MADRDDNYTNITGYENYDRVDNGETARTDEFAGSAPVDENGGNMAEDNSSLFSAEELDSLMDEAGGSGISGVAAVERTALDDFVDKLRLTQEEKAAWAKIKNFMDKAGSDDRLKAAGFLLMNDTEKQIFKSDYYAREAMRAAEPGSIPPESDREIHELAVTTDALRSDKIKTLLNEAYPDFFGAKAVENALEEVLFRAENQERVYAQLQPPIDGITVIKAGDKVILNIRKAVNATDIVNLNEWMRENRDMLILDGRSGINGVSISLKAGSVLLTDELAEALRETAGGHLPYFEMKTGSMEVDPETAGNPVKALLSDTSQLHVWGKDSFDLSYEKNGRVVNPLSDIYGLTVTHGASLARYNSDKKMLTPQVTEIGIGSGVRSIADMQYGEGAVVVKENSMAANYVNLDPEFRDESIRKVAETDRPFVLYSFKAAYGTAFRELVRTEERVGGPERITAEDWKQYLSGGSGRIAVWAGLNRDALEYAAAERGFENGDALLKDMADAFSKPFVLNKEMLLNDAVLRRVYGNNESVIAERRDSIEKLLEKKEDELYDLSTKNSSPLKIGTLFRAAVEYEKEERERRNAVIEASNSFKKEGEERTPFIEPVEIINFRRMDYAGRFALMEDNLFTEKTMQKEPVFKDLTAFMHKRMENDSGEIVYKAVDSVVVNGLEDALKCSEILQRDVQKTIDRDRKTLEHALARKTAAIRPDAEKRVLKMLEKEADLELTLAERTAGKLLENPEEVLRDKPGLRAPGINEKLEILENAVKTGDFSSYYYGNINGIKDLVRGVYGDEFESDAKNVRVVLSETFEEMVDDELHTDEIRHIENILKHISTEDEFNARRDAEIEKRRAGIEDMISSGTFWREYDNNTDGLGDFINEVFGKENFEKANPPDNTRVAAKFSNRENYLAAMSRDIEYKFKTVTRETEKKDALQKELGLVTERIKGKTDELRSLISKQERLQQNKAAGEHVENELKESAENQKAVENEISALKKKEAFFEETVKNFDNIAATQNREFARQFYDAYITAEKLYGGIMGNEDRLGSVFINAGNMSVKDAGLAGRSFGQIVNNPLRYNELLKKHAENIANGFAEFYKNYERTVKDIDAGRFFIDSTAAERYKTRLAGIKDDSGGDNAFAAFKNNLKEVEEAEKNLNTVWNTEFNRIAAEASGKIHSGNTLRKLKESREITDAVNRVNSAYKALTTGTLGFDEEFNNTLKDMYYELKPEVREDFMDALAPDGGMCILKDGSGSDSVVNTCLPLKLVQGVELFNTLAKKPDKVLCIGQGAEMDFGALYGTRGIQAVVQWNDEAYRKEYEDIKSRNKDEKMELRTFLDGVVSYCTDGDRKSSEGISLEKLEEKIRSKQSELGKGSTEALVTIAKQKLFDLEQITAWEKLNPELADYIALLSKEGVELRNAWTKARENESKVNDNHDSTQVEKYDAHVKTAEAEAAYEDFKRSRSSEFGRWVYNNSDVKFEAGNSVPNGEEEVYVNEKLKEPLKLTTNEGTMKTVTASPKERKGYKNSQIFAARLSLAADSLKAAAEEFMRGFKRLTIVESLFYILLGSFLLTKSTVGLPVKAARYGINESTAQKSAAIRAGIGAWKEDMFEKVRDENFKVVGIRIKPEALETIKAQGISVKDGGRTVRIDLEKSSGGRFTGIHEFDASLLLNLKNKEDADLLMARLEAKERKARAYVLERNNVKLRRQQRIFDKIEEKEEKINEVYAEDSKFRRDNLVTASGKANPVIEKKDDKLKGTAGYGPSTKEPLTR